MRQTWISVGTLVVFVAVIGLVVNYAAPKQRPVVQISDYTVVGHRCPDGWTEMDYSSAYIPPRENCLTCGSIWKAKACIPPEAAK